MAQVRCGRRFPVHVHGLTYYVTCTLLLSEHAGLLCEGPIRDYGAPRL